MSKRGSSSLLGNISIRVRIFSGFSLVLVLLTAIATLSVFALERGVMGFNQYSRFSDNAVRLVEIKFEISEMRRNAIMFAQDGETSALDATRALIQSLDTHLSEAKKLELDAERSASLRHVEELKNAYKANFEKVVIARHERERLAKDKMNVLGLEARKMISAIAKSAMEEGDMQGAAYAGLTQEVLLLGRLNANRFLANPTDSLASDTKDYLQRFAKLSDDLASRVKSAKNQAAAREAGEQAKAYLASFLEAEAQTRIVDNLVERVMREQGRQITEIISETTARSHAAMVNLEKVSAAEDATAIMTSKLLAGGALLLGMLIAYAVGNSIVKPLYALRDVIVKVQDTGHLSLRASLAGKNEIAQTAAAFDDMLNDIEHAMKGVNAVMAQVAANDLTARVNFAAKGDAATLKANTNQSLDLLSGTVQTLMNDFRQVAAATEQATVAIKQILSGAEIQVNALRQVLMALDQTARSVEEVAESAKHSSDQARRSTELVRMGTSQIDSMFAVVGSIAASGQRIETITETITGISRRIDMLSLNASIEASSAGAAGRGFAVVATEVGNLAKHSSTAVSNISQLVAASSTQTQEGVKISGTVRQSIIQIGEGVYESERMAGAIAAAIEQQEAAVVEIKASAEELNRIGESNVVAAEEISATMMSLLQMVKDGMSRFKF